MSSPSPQASAPDAICFPLRALRAATTTSVWLAFPPETLQWLWDVTSGAGDPRADGAPPRGVPAYPVFRSGPDQGRIAVVDFAGDPPGVAPGPSLVHGPPFDPSCGLPCGPPSGPGTSSVGASSAGASDAGAWPLATWDAVVAAQGRALAYTATLVVQDAVGHGHFLWRAEWVDAEVLPTGTRPGTRLGAPIAHGGRGGHGVHGMGALVRAMAHTRVQDLGTVWALRLSLVADARTADRIATEMGRLLAQSPDALPVLRQALALPHAAAWWRALSPVGWGRVLDSPFPSLRTDALRMVETAVPTGASMGGPAGAVAEAAEAAAVAPTGLVAGSVQGARTGSGR